MIKLCAATWPATNPDVHLWYRIRSPCGRLPDEGAPVDAHHRRRHAVVLGDEPRAPFMVDNVVVDDGHVAVRLSVLVVLMEAPTWVAIIVRSSLVPCNGGPLSSGPRLAIGIAPTWTIALDGRVVTRSMLLAVGTSAVVDVLIRCHRAVIAVTHVLVGTFMNGIAVASSGRLPRRVHNWPTRSGRYRADIRLTTLDGSLHSRGLVALPHAVTGCVRQVAGDQDRYDGGCNNMANAR